jgi:UDP-N-acetylmuramate--alanine ligase
MTEQQRYFFCGIGGSGMLPLALILRARGAIVEGSDRALDQGNLAAKFDYLCAQDMTLFPQDGSGLVSGDQTLVASAAIEDTVPDVKAALDLGCQRLTRAELLSQLFNDAEMRIGIGGTSGKSTTTGMIGWVLHQAGLAPTIMNGAVMKNFASEDALFASALVGSNKCFVSELDESDGSIALFSPTISLLNNIAHDHKSMEELYTLFGDFTAKANTAVLNMDDAESDFLRNKFPEALTFSLENPTAHYRARDITPAPTAISFTIHEKASGETADVQLATPGRHNVANALAATCVARAAGVELQTIAAALTSFAGIKRRFEIVGTKAGVTVIDDFGHNPDKIAATLRTLHDFPGRLLVMFQPHGFGPLRKLKDDFITCFQENLYKEDHLLLPEPVYYGGTVDRSVSSQHIIAGVKQVHAQAEALPTRADCGDRLIELAQKGDRIIVMGARDDTLSQFAEDILNRVAEKLS